MSNLVLQIPLQSLHQFNTPRSNSQTAASAPSQAPQTRQAEHPAPSMPRRQKRSLSDADDTVLDRALTAQRNLRSAGQKINEIATRLGVNASPQAILSALKTTPIDINIGASYRAEADSGITLETYLLEKGLSVPTTHFALTALADALLNRSQVHPLGDFGGGLSWPLPLSINEQRRVLDASRHYITEHPDTTYQSSSSSMLEYLNGNLPLTTLALNDPAKALEDLLGSTRAQALGQFLQTQLNGIGTDTSVYDYALAAINLLLDPGAIAESHTTKVCGFDLAQQSHWGRPASEVQRKLAYHLSDEGYTSSEMSQVGAYLLLARKAPELLIKDIPDNVTYGSAAWLSLSIAAATIEAQTPGKVPNMSFAQVMMATKKAGREDPLITQKAQTAALRIWGTVNGVLSHEEADRYDTVDIEKVRNAFNQQANARIAAADQIEAEIPDRKAITLAKLRERFGENVPFEEKLLTVKDTVQPYAQPLYDPNPKPAGRHSLLDIAMSGLHRFEWQSTDQRVVDATRGKSLKFDVNSVFNDQFSLAIDTRKKGIAAAVKQMITQLPLKDREALEYGKLEFHQNHTYLLGLGLTGRTLDEKNHKLLIKASGVEDDRVYEMDLKQGTIKHVHDSVLTKARERNANRVFPIEKFTPQCIAETTFDQHQDVSGPRPIPDSFSSTRTQAIADAFIEHLDIDNIDVVKQAKGSTTFDKQLESQSTLGNFFLDLIPLRSAIVNFTNGNYLDGAIDLGMDIFGFVTAGVGTVAKVAKVGAKAVSRAVKALKITKILGTTVIGELNPLSGAGDLLQGGIKLLSKGVDKIKTLSGSYDLTKLSSIEHGPITHGTFKAAGQTYEGDTILSNAQRYAYDPAKQKPYGTPLEEFSPLDGLGPQSPNVNIRERRIPSSRGQRYDPIQTQRRPANGVTKTDHLPENEYVASINGASSDAHFTPSRKEATRKKFNLEMNDFYRRMAAGERPKRPVIPDIRSEIKPSELLEKALDSADGVVLGESHKQMASFQTLYDNVDTFKQKGVKKLYMEATFYDAQNKLADDGIGFLGDGVTPRFPSFNQLVRKFTDAGIEVIPLDHPYLTRHKDERDLFKKLNGAADHVPRLKEFNYYATQTIRRNSAGEKWVALVGNAHMHTSQGVTGLAELTGGIGVGVLARKTPGPSIGTRDINHAPNPESRIGPTDIPGDLQIFKVVKVAPPR